MSAINSQSLYGAGCISANIEGLTASKASIVSDICKRERCQWQCLQETHISINLPRPKIAGKSLVSEHPYKKYNSAILICNDMKIENIYKRVHGNVEIITMVMPGVVVHYVYTPPNNPLDSHR